ncbi:MAG: hypothetical protein HGGPFJEG_00427 [Ignavibacteria bacterium]|nr:hypothetical protein [Ignavibacteria bacterium]
MAKSKQHNVQSLKSKKQKKELSHLHFAMTAKNYMIIGAGILVIIIGYVLMSENSVDGFMPTVVAPILLILGYCVIVPVGILFNDRGVTESETEEIKTETKANIQNVSSVSSNIKTS